MVVLKILLNIFTASDLASASLWLVSVCKLYERQGDLLGRDQDPFCHRPGCEAYSNIEENCGNQGQLLELRVPKGGPQELDEINGASTVANQVANGNHPTRCDFSAFASTSYRVKNAYPRQSQAAVWRLAVCRQ